MARYTYVSEAAYVTDTKRIVDLARGGAFLAAEEEEVVIMSP